jgi:predicted nucleotidyltransferase
METKEFDYWGRGFYPPGRVILEGVVGSQAYGMATPESDTDLAGIYVAKTEDLLGFGAKPKGTVVHKDPDVTYHEVEKFMGLAVKCNPTVTELLWLDEYTVLTYEGKALINAREAFLSESYVRSAYMGYATSQAKKLEKRENDGLEGFGSAVKKRSPKHKRHLMRLCFQCEDLLTTGELNLRVKDPQLLFDFGEQPSEVVIDWFNAMQKRIDSLVSVLPKEPDMETLDDLLLLIRRSNSSLMPIGKRYR